MAFLLAAFATLAFADETVFPTVVTEDLNGRRVTLPDDLEGRRRLVLVGYDRDQQATLDVWIASAVALKKGAALGIYEVPIVDDPGAVGRGLIDAGMKLAVRDDATRGRIFTVYTDKPALMKRLELSDDDTVDLMLLDESGRVLWRESGEATPAKMASLLKAVDGA